MSYSDKYVNVFKNCLKSSDDKYIDGIQLYTILMLNLRNIKPGCIYLFSRLYIYLWKHNKKFAEHIMYSIINSDDIQYLECYYEFEWIIQASELEIFPYTEYNYIYQTFTKLMCCRLKKDWDNYISGSSVDISYCTLLFIKQNRNDIFSFNYNIVNNNGSYSFDNQPYLYHFIVNNNELIYEMVKSACDKKIDNIDFNYEWQFLIDEPSGKWEDLVSNLNNTRDDYVYLNMILKNVLGLLYNEIIIRKQHNKLKITKPVIFNTVDECYSLICFVNEYIKNTHENNIFTILPTEIIMKIIASSNNDHINNIINNFFYPK